MNKQKNKKKVYKIIFCKTKSCNKRIEITNPRITTQQYCKKCAKKRSYAKCRRWNKKTDYDQGYREKNRGEIRKNNR